MEELPTPSQRRRKKKQNKKKTKKKNCPSLRMRSLRRLSDLLDLGPRGAGRPTAERQQRESHWWRISWPQSWPTLWKGGLTRRSFCTNSLAGPCTRTCAWRTKSLTPAALEEDGDAARPASLTTQAGTQLINRALCHPLGKDNKHFSCSLAMIC